MIISDKHIQAKLNALKDGVGLWIPLLSLFFLFSGLKVSTDSSDFESALTSMAASFRDNI
jgi:hypothetical protein